MDTFKDTTAHELIKHTHKVGSPWYNAAKTNQVLELLLSEQLNYTEFSVNMLELIAYDTRKQAIYEEHLDSVSYFTQSKPATTENVH